jgi:hypothetical protein
MGVPSTAVLSFGTGEISCAVKYQSWTEGVQQWVKGPSNTVRCSQETHGLFETECIERQTHTQENKICRTSV